jgi:hypothetical protein
LPSADERVELLDLLGSDQGSDLRPGSELAAPIVLLRDRPVSEAAFRRQEPRGVAAAGAQLRSAAAPEGAVGAQLLDRCCVHFNTPYRCQLHYALVAGAGAQSGGNLPFAGDLRDFDRVPVRIVTLVTSAEHDRDAVGTRQTACRSADDPGQIVHRLRLVDHLSKSRGFGLELIERRGASRAGVIQSGLPP